MEPNVERSHASWLSENGGGSVGGSLGGSIGGSLMVNSEWCCLRDRDQNKTLSKRSRCTCSPE